MRKENVFCPSCGKKMSETGHGYLCTNKRCGIENIHDVSCGQKIPDRSLRALIRTGKAFILVKGSFMQLTLNVTGSISVESKEDDGMQNTQWFNYEGFGRMRRIGNEYCEFSGADPEMIRENLCKGGLSALANPSGAKLEKVMGFTEENKGFLLGGILKTKLGAEDIQVVITRIYGKAGSKEVLERFSSEFYDADEFSMQDGNCNAWWKIGQQKKEGAK